LLKKNEDNFDGFKINNVIVEQKANNVSIIPKVNQNKNHVNDIFSADIYFETFSKNEWNPQHESEYSKMFDNSFDYDKDYMFHEE